MLGNVSVFPNINSVHTESLEGLTSGFGMLPGVSPPLWSPATIILKEVLYKPYGCLFFAQTLLKKIGFSSSFKLMLCCMAKNTKPKIKAPNMASFNCKLLSLRINFTLMKTRRYKQKVIKPIKKAFTGRLVFIFYQPFFRFLYLFLIFYLIN